MLKLRVDSYHCCRRHLDFPICYIIGLLLLINHIVVLVPAKQIALFFVDIWGRLWWTARPGGTRWLLFLCFCGPLSPRCHLPSWCSASPSLGCTSSNAHRGRLSGLSVCHCKKVACTLEHFMTDWLVLRSSLLKRIYLLIEFLPTTQSTYLRPVLSLCFHVRWDADFALLTV